MLNSAILLAELVAHIYVYEQLIHSDNEILLCQ
jgi:hypothetical protein